MIETRLKPKAKIDWIVLVVFLVAVLGSISTVLVEKSAENRERNLLLTRANITAAAIGPDDMDELTGTADDLGTTQYQALKATVTHIKQIQKDVRFVYLMGYKGGDALFFYVDSEDPSSEDYSAPGDVYNDTSAVQLDAFQNQKAIVEGPYQDEWGSWVSGFAPILDPQTGKTAALVGIDIAADSWSGVIFLEMLVPILITLSLISLLLLYDFFRRRTRRFILQIETSEAEAEEQGDRLRTLYNIGTKQRSSVPEQFRAALKTGNDTLHTRLALLNRIEGGSFTILYASVPPDTVHEGDQFALAETYCDLTVREDALLAIDTMSTSAFKQHACYKKFGLESYIGVPIKVSGQLFGTLTFFSPDPHRPGFSESDKDFVRLMGAWVSATLERQEIDRMKSEFVSVASHQLRTPLTGIKWFAELMLKGKAGVLSAEQKDFLQQIFDSNERMIKLVNDLLNVSRIETGTKFVITKTSTDLIPILRSLTVELVALAAAHTVTLKLSLPEKLVLNVDEEKMRQVLQNLMSNAVKYSKAGGVVEVGLLEPKEAGFVTLFVKDSGLGVPEKQKPRMFEKFFRADNVQTAETEGTGLGLYIAKAIVEGHGGKLWFESTENVGTCFYIKLLG